MSGMPKIPGNTRYFRLPYTRWFSKLNQVVPGIKKMSGSGRVSALVVDYNIVFFFRSILSSSCCRHYLISSRLVVDIPQHSEEASCGAHLVTGGCWRVKILNPQSHALFAWKLCYISLYSGNRLVLPWWMEVSNGCWWLRMTQRPGREIPAMVGGGGGEAPWIGGSFSPDCHWYSPGSPITIRFNM